MGKTRLGRVVSSKIKNKRQKIKEALAGNRVNQRRIGGGRKEKGSNVELIVSFVSTLWILVLAMSQRGKTQPKTMKGMNKMGLQGAPSPFTLHIHDVA